MSKSEDKAWWQGLFNPLIFITIIAIVAAIVALMLGHRSVGYDKIDFLANVTVFLASSLFSYIITSFNSTEAQKKGTKALVSFASRRINLSIKDTVKLSSTIERHAEDFSELRSLIVYNLKSLSDDMYASLDEIHEIGELQTKERITENIDYNCQTCGHPNESSLKTIPGSTASPECESCNSKTFIHRLKEGKFKTSAPNNGINKPFQYQRNIPFKRSPRQSVSFECPACDSEFTAKSNGIKDEKIKRVCKGCLDTLEYDTASSTTTIIKKNADNPTIHNVDPNNFSCSTCSTVFKPSIDVSTSSDIRFIYCEFCHTVHQFETPTMTATVTKLTHSNPKKSKIKINCPSEDCVHEITTDFFSDLKYINRGCSECTSTFMFYVDTSKIEPTNSNLQKYTLDNLNKETVMCSCGDTLYTNFVKTNSKGTKYLDCHKCGNFTQFE